MPGTAEKKEGGRRRLTPSARRALIEQAATRVFAKRGYGAATMQEIAGAAGVVASVLYDHYPSKRELYIALLEQHGKALIESTTGAPGGPDLRGELRRRIENYFNAIEENPFVWQMLFRDPPDDPQIAAAHTRIHAEAARRIAEGLSGGPATGDGPSEPELAQIALVATMIKSSLNGVAIWWDQNRQMSRETMIETATTVLWDGLSAASTKS